MKRHRLAAVAVSILTTAALALVVAGGAAAKATTLGSLTLQATPATVGVGGSVELSGVLQVIGSDKGYTVTVSEYSAPGCHFSDWVGFVGSDKTDSAGAYSVTAESLTLGMHYYQAAALLGILHSPCVAVTVSATPVAAVIPQGPDRYGYCSVAGNTDATGTPLGVGTFLNLEYGQPATDDHYTGATPAFWVEGVGVTCDLSPSQAAIAAASTAMVNHIGESTTEAGPLFYTFIPKG